MLLSTCFACQENQRGFIEICNFRLKKIIFKNLCSLLGHVSILKIAELMLWTSLWAIDFMLNRFGWYGTCTYRIIRQQFLGSYYNSKNGVKMLGTG